MVAAAIAMYLCINLTTLKKLEPKIGEEEAKELIEFMWQLSSKKRNLLIQ